MRNLIADLKLFLQNGGESLILKHDFHKGDDFVEGYRIVGREEIGAIIEFFASTEEDRIDSDVFEYNYDPVDLDEVRSSLSIHSTSDKDVNDMARIFDTQIGDCHWLDTIATCQMNNQLTITEDTYATTLSPKLLRMRIDFYSLSRKSLASRLFFRRLPACFDPFRLKSITRRMKVFTSIDIAATELPGTYMYSAASDD